MRIVFSVLLLFPVLSGFAQNPFSFVVGGSGSDGCSGISMKDDTLYMSNTINDYFGITSGFELRVLNATGDSIESIIHNSNMNWTAKFTVYATAIASTGRYYINSQDLDLALTLIYHSGSIDSKHFGGPGIELGYAITSLSDSGYIIVGTTNSFGAGGYDAYIIRTDKNGDSLWTKTFGGIGFEEARAIERRSDSTFYVCGTTSSFGAQWTDIFILEINLNGDTSCFKMFGDVGNDQARAMVKTSDGGFAICGWQLHNTSIDGEFKLLKIDSNADLVFSKSYGYIGMDEAWDIKETFDHGFILVGYSEQMNAGEDVYIVRTDSVGDTLWTRILGGPYNERAYSVVQTPDSGFAIVGLTYSFGAGDADAFFLKLDKNGNLTTNIGLIQPAHNPRIYVYPNPASDIVNIMIPDFFQSEKVSYEIIDACGRLLKRGEAQSSQSIILINLKDLDNGAYFVRLCSPQYSTTQKLIVRKSY